MDFKSKVNFSKRTILSSKMKTQYNRVPIILLCDKSLEENNIKITNTKYLLPKDIELGHFLFNIKNKININQNQGFIIFINKELPNITSLLGELYEKYKDNDGFLYITLTVENTFG